jgi:hypothetical protein
MANSEFFKGFVFGLGQSAAGVIVIGIFGKAISLYILRIFKEIEKQENTKKGTVDINMQNIYERKDNEESLLSDGETIQINLNPNIRLKKL